MLKLFTQHPKHMGQSYIEHCLKGLTTTFQLLSITVISLIHSLLPWLLASKTSEKVIQLAAQLAEKRTAMLRDRVRN